jgi:hypothetical protein
VLELADQDPGFVINADGSSGEVFYPLRRWTGEHTFTIVNRADQDVNGTPPPAAGSIAVTVLGPDGAPLADASVNLTGYSTIAGLTDATGAVTLPGVPAGPQRVTAAKDGYSRVVSEFGDVQSGQTPAVTVTLRDKTPPVVQASSAGGAMIGGSLYVGAGGAAISVTSSEGGDIYLVPGGTLPVGASLVAAVEADGSGVHGVTAQASAAQAVELSNQGFAPGAYVVYGVDGVGNVSAGVGVVMIAEDVDYVDNEDAIVIYSGTWTKKQGPVNESQDYRGGTLGQTRESGAYVDIPFYGQSAEVEYALNNSRGIAEFYVDGQLADTVDLYSSTPLNHQVVFSTGSLAAGAHVVRIRHTGEANPAANQGYPWVGFDDLHVLG